MLCDEEKSFCAKNFFHCVINWGPFYKIIVFFYKFNMEYFQFNTIGLKDSETTRTFFSNNTHFQGHLYLEFFFFLQIHKSSFNYSKIINLIFHYLTLFNLTFFKYCALPLKFFTQLLWVKKIFLAKANLGLREKESLKANKGIFHFFSFFFFVINYLVIKNIFSFLFQGSKSLNIILRKKRPFNYVSKSSLIFFKIYIYATPLVTNKRFNFMRVNDFFKVSSLFEKI